MARPTSLKPGRKPISGRPSLATASPAHKPLSPREVLIERLAWACDMLGLVEADATLPPELQARVRLLGAAVRAVWGELRQYP